MKKILPILALVATSSFTSVANAGLVFVGSWNVYNDAAPHWTDNSPNGPLAYTGQEAAALLFGGIASNYSISTIDNLVANINNLAWYDVIGFGGRELSGDYSNKYLGMFYGPNNDYSPGNENNSASAFIRDNLSFDGRINYAFIDDSVSAAVPEPSIISLFLASLAGMTFFRRRAQGAAKK